jgi:hypothetical protein
VLPEANFVWVKAKFDQEELYTSHKVAYCLVVDGTVLNCFAEGGRRSISLTRELNVPVEEINLNVDNFMKTVVLLPAFRINVTLKVSTRKVSSVSGELTVQSQPLETREREVTQL